MLDKQGGKSLGFSIAGGKGSTPAYEDVDEVCVCVCVCVSHNLCVYVHVNVFMDICMCAMLICQQAIKVTSFFTYFLEHLYHQDLSRWCGRERWQTQAWRQTTEGTLHVYTYMSM